MTETTLRPSRSFALLATLIALAALVVASIAIGSNALSPEAVWHALFDYTGSYDDAVVRDSRLPRTLLGVLVGLALGLAGALLQGITRNPIADPGLLGINHGSALAIVLASAVFGLRTPGTMVWFAFAGAVGATALVYALGGVVSRTRLVLAGVAVQATFVGVNQAMQVIDTHTLDQMRFWLVGTLANRDVGTLAPLLPFLITGVVLALGCTRGLNALALGEDSARGLGSNPALTRTLGMIAVGLLCGAATAAAGPIAFVGLMIPHLVRLLVGQDQRWVLPMSLVLGPVLVLGCDVLGRVLGSPGELQVGIVTDVVGGIVFLALIRGRRQS